MSPIYLILLAAIAAVCIYFGRQKGGGDDHCPEGGDCVCDQEAPPENTEETFDAEKDTN